MLSVSTLLRYLLLVKLSKRLVEKPWGRTDIPAVFGDFGGRQIGEIWYESEGDFVMPVLVKWLFTSEKLSIQVHPNNKQAQQRGLPSGKEECWYVVDAEPGAVLGIGTTSLLDSDSLRTASLDGSIEQLMDWKPVKAGDFFYIPAGTVHAIGAGVTLVEVQQYADITYRLYDYGRLDNGKLRELHLDDGVAVSRAGPYTDARSGTAETGDQLVDGPHFRLWLVKGDAQLDALLDNSDRWVVPLAGEVHVGENIGVIGDCLYAAGSERIMATPDARFLLAAL